MRLIGGICIAVGLIASAAVWVMNPDKTKLRLLIDHWQVYLPAIAAILGGLWIIKKDEPNGTGE